MEELERRRRQAHQAVDLLEQEWRDRRPITALDDAFQRRTFEPLPAGGLEGVVASPGCVEPGILLPNGGKTLALPAAHIQLPQVIFNLDRPVRPCQQAGGFHAAP